MNDDWRDRVTAMVERHVDRQASECIYLHGPGGEGQSHSKILSERFPNVFHCCKLSENNAAELMTVVTKREHRSLTILLSNLPPESRGGIRRIPMIMGPVTVVHAHIDT